MKIAIIDNAGAYCTDLILVFIGAKMYYILFSVVLLTSLSSMSMDHFNRRKITKDLHLVKLGETLHSAIESGGFDEDGNKYNNIQWVKQILEQNNAVVNIKTKNGLTPLDLALREDRLDVAWLLLAKGGKTRAWVVAHITSV